MSYVASQAGWSLGANVVGLLVRYVLVLVVARHYGALSLGIYTLSIAVAIAGSLLANFGMDRIVLRFAPYHRSRGEYGLERGVQGWSTRTVIVSSAVVGFALFVGAPWIASAFDEAALTDAFRIVAVGIPAMAIGQVLRARMRATEDVRLAVSLEQVVAPGINLVVVLGVLGVASGPWILAPVVGQTVGQTVACGISAFVVLRKQWAHADSSQTVPEWLAYGIPMWLEAFVIMLLASADQILLGHLASVEQVGLYAPGARLAVLVGAPLLALNVAVAPMIARLDGSGEEQRLQELYGKLNWGMALIGLSTAGVLILVGGHILAFFGPTFTETFDAFLILVAGQMVSMMTGASGILLTMLGWGKLALGNAVLALALDVTLGVALIPEHGFVGAAIGASVALAVVSLLQVGQVRMLTPYRSFPLSGLMFWLHRVRTTFR